MGARSTSGVAAILGLALSSAALTVVGPAAPSAASEGASEGAAEGEAPVLRWEVSQQFDDHLSAHVLEDGATEDAAGVVTFPGGVGTYDPATGEAQVQYQGAVRGAFSFVGSEFYHVRIEDPALTVGSDGRGEMTALVSAANVAAQGNEAEETDPVRVVLFGFDAGAGDWSPSGDLAALATTPDWAGTLEPGSEEAEELGLDEGHPLEGKSWAATFLRQITSGVRAHFHATGSGSDEKKAPAPFVAEATPTGVVPEPAPAAPLELDWAVSPEFAGTYETETTGGATAADGVLTFPDGEGTHDPVTGVTTVAYAGSVTGTVPDPVLGLTTAYALTLADPVLEVDDTGAGRLTAMVSGETPSPLPPLVPGTATEPRRVPVATLQVAAEDWDVEAGEPGGEQTGLATLTTTPQWESVGRSFPSAYLAQLTEESRDHFRDTSIDGSQGAKAPAPLTATATALPGPEPEPEPEPQPEPQCDPEPTDPQVTVTDVSAGATPEGGRTVRVEGTGFRAVSCEGDAGLYVGVAEGSTLPDVSDRDNIALFVQAAYVAPSGVVDGAFDQLLTLDPAELEEGVDYSVFTWQAHTHSNTTQDTVTPLPAATQPGPTTVPTGTDLGWKREPTTRRVGVLRVAVTADEGRPRGTVRLRVTHDGRTARLTAQPKAHGRATVRIAARARGRMRVVAVFRGEEPWATSRDRTTIRVRRR